MMTGTTEPRTALRRFVLAAAAAGIGLTLLPPTGTTTAATVAPAVVSSSQATPAPDPVVAKARVRPRLSKVYIVGDSITYRSRLQMHKRAPEWTVDGVPGREVWELPHLLTERLAMRPVPKHVVIALGSNGSPTWHRQQYVDAVNLLPVTTRVTFVTMWRNPERWGNARKTPRKHSKLLRGYSRSVKEIARDRPNTCVYNWRRVAKKRHERIILADGVHPNRRGTKVWARGVERTVKDCAHRPLAS